MLALGAGVHEGLSDDRQRGVHDFRHVDVEDEVGILQNVHPKTQRKAAEEGDQKAAYQSNIPAADQLGLRFIKRVLSCENLQVQSSAVHSNNRDGEEAFFYMSV